MQWEGLGERGHFSSCSHAFPQQVMDVVDVVVGQRITQPGPLYQWQEVLRRRARGLRPGGGSPALVYETDDDLLSINTAKNPLGKYLRQQEPRRVMVECLETADLITVSTEPLARSMRRFNDNVIVLPNSLPTTVFDVPLNTRRGRHGPVVLGWQGSITHKDDWAIVKPVVKQLLEEWPHLLMHFLGTPYADGLPVHKIKFKQWTTDLNLHYRRSANFDIGLAPLERNPFNDAKSGLKFMEGAALGVPMVCSRVPAYADLVEHGVTGFLASTPAQWYEHISALIEDPALRLRMGDAAREAARAWTIDKHIHRWESAYQSLLTPESASEPTNA